MKKIGTMLVVLALVAMAPSYAYGKKASRVAATKPISAKADNSALFKGVHKKIIFVNNVDGNDSNSGKPNSPVATIQYAQTLLAGKAGVIYVEYTTEPYVLDATLTLLEGQSLIGSCVRLKIEGKEIPASTNHRPMIQIGTDYVPVEFGILVTQNNQIAGLSFTGSGLGTNVAISSPVKDFLPVGVLGNCLIANNRFNSLGGAISQLYLQENATVEIDGNYFASDVTTGIFSNQVITFAAEERFCHNHFEGNEAGIDLLPPIKSEGRSKNIQLPKRLTSVGSSSCPCQPKTNLLSAADLPKDSSRIKQASSGFKLFVEGNTFDKATTENVITMHPSQELSLKNNKFINSSSRGFSTLIELNNATAHIEKNTCSNNSTSLGLVVLSGATAYVAGNTFSNNGEGGLGLTLANGGTACVTKNTFSNNTGAGFLCKSFESTNCLQLLDNRGENNAGGDFVIANESAPELFEAAICDNIGTLTSTPLTLVQQCSECQKSK